VARETSQAPTLPGLRDRPVANGVELYHWNPRRPLRPGRVWRALPVRRRVNNFGDLLGPVIVRRLLERLGLTDQATRSSILVSVGSVMHAAAPGAVIWGTGINGDMPIPEDLQQRNLDVRAVRGPLTRSALLDRGIACPPVYGDPGLLLGNLFPELQDLPTSYPVTVVPHMHDWRTFERTGTHHYLDPRGPLGECLHAIGSSRLVVSSSLHGVIVAEALGRRAVLLRSGAQAEFKYRDYYEGTGRPDFQIFDTVTDAVRLGDPAAPSWAPDALIAAFPRDLWQRVAR
jgi:pyruvyltransferase